MKFQFESFAAFISMNGHGGFVWAAYAITFAALGYLLIAPVLEHKLFIKQQQKQQQKVGDTSPNSVESEQA